MSSNHGRGSRFVSTWNVCCGHAAMTPNTAAMKSKGIFWWNRSDMLSTKMRRGLRQCSGLASASGTVRTAPDQSTPCLPLRVRPS